MCDDASIDCFDILYYTFFVRLFQDSWLLPRWQDSGREFRDTEVSGAEGIV